MGCAASVGGPGERRLPVTYKLLVMDWDIIGEAGDAFPLETHLDVYSTRKFKLTDTIHIRNDVSDKEMYLCGAFSIACHREMPFLIISGGVWADEDGNTKPSNSVWKVDISKDTKLISKLSDIPTACQDHLSCVCTHGEDSFLYIFTSESGTWCLNLDTDNWDMLQNLPLDVCDVIQVVTYQNVIGFITEKCDLQCYTAPVDYVEDWNEDFSQPLPDGLFGEADGYLFSLSGEDNALFRTNLKTAEFGRVTDIDDLDIRTLQKSTCMTGCGDRLYFSGHHYSDDTKTVIEVNLRKKRTIVAGYLSSSDYHKVMACQVPMRRFSMAPISMKDY